MNLKIKNYQNVRFDTGIPMEQVESLFVRVITGDEIVTVHKTDGTEEEFDSACLADNPRITDYWDGDYGVHKDDLEAWSKRKTSYDGFRYAWRGPMNFDGGDNIEYPASETEGH